MKSQYNDLSPELKELISKTGSANREEALAAQAEFGQAYCRSFKRKVSYLVTLLPTYSNLQFTAQQPKSNIHSMLSLRVKKMSSLRTPTQALVVFQNVQRKLITLKSQPTGLPTQSTGLYVSPVTLNMILLAVT